MITQWDIISSIRPKDNALVYALLIDGTEHDARLIAKKLQGYVRPAQPAMAPYVYRFPTTWTRTRWKKSASLCAKALNRPKRSMNLYPAEPWATRCLMLV